ncbi:hypothetical protein CR492_19910 [Methylocella silvestris]|uniref:DUF6306 domain-containing protein n=2 Tax=Methylocella silvestris TaxID=199596 RepID=A0A2J7TBS7_METSI|nr:hypothetical protein CR492_19910 [Methylocella silvestris]
MHEADDAYMGFLGKDELTALLNELHEAGRAAARVAIESIHAAGGGPIAELMRKIQWDEACWQTMLIRRIIALDGTLSPKADASYNEAMAIADLGERIALLNRSQGSVARKLHGALPRVRDGRLRADLAEKLRSLEDNIALIDDVVTRNS